MLNGRDVGSLPAPPTYFTPKPTPPPTPPSAPPPTAPYNPYQSDPGYQNALQNQTLGSGSIDANLNSQIQQRLLALGDPGLASKYGVDPSVLSAANASGNTVLSRLGQIHQQNLRSIINQLAAHGLVFSGDTGYRSGQEDQNYGHQTYDAQQAALSDLLGYQSAALQQKQSLQDAVANALQNAYQNYLSHPELGAYGQNPANSFGTAQQIQAALTRLSRTPDARNGY